MAARILVIRGGAIGDFILTVPVLSALRNQFPNAELEILGYSHIASLAKEGGVVTSVRSIDARPLAGFFARGSELDTGLQQYFAGFAIILSFLYDPDEIFQTNVRRCSKAQFIVAPHRPDERSGIHATEAYLKPLERLAVFDADPTPRLSFESAARFAGVAIHPGSGSAQKNWPEARWAELLTRLLRETGLNVLLVGGEAEEGRMERLQSGHPAERITLARSLPLPQLARLLTGVKCFAGHDSGISHLAAALGVPTLALWGETPESIWRPRGEHVSILKKAGGLESLAVEDVLAQIKTLLKA